MRNWRRWIASNLWQARVSTNGQSVSAQVQQLTKAARKKVTSGAETDRTQLREVLDQRDLLALIKGLTPKSGRDPYLIG